MSDSFRSRLWSTLWPWLLRCTLFGIMLAVGFLVPYTWRVDQFIKDDFARLSWQIPTRVYAESLLLKPGQALSKEALHTELAASRYRKLDQLNGSGSYTEDNGTYTIHTRAFTGMHGRESSRVIQFELKKNRLRRLRDGDGNVLKQARLDPARIATLYGAQQEDRELVKLEHVPNMLVMTLQAVEDRNFNHHHGIDYVGIARAIFTNIARRKMTQGGSTLTQQLARNLYLSRERKISRKLYEMHISMLIESRFSKKQIMEAYLNEVYLGQHGGQAIHGVAAAADYWFGRNLEQLEPSQIALLVGMIKGPSLYDPARKPKTAKDRRNTVLDQMLATGIIDQTTADAEKAKPLGVVGNPSLARNRYPAYMQLVHQQLAADYPEDSLKGAGLNILTHLSIHAQQAAEQGLGKHLANVSSKNRPALQGAMVVSDTQRGAVIAIVGDKDQDAQGFNRALEARRPIGSLVKPFVFMLALAQPGRYALASPVSDEPLTLKLRNGKTWSPKNSDNKNHGMVALQDALVHSYNIATVRVGLDIGVERLSSLLEVLAGVDAPPHPALLLGSVDLTPYEVTKLFQFIAAHGQMQPLRVVEGVLDANANPIARFDVALPPAQRGDVIASGLVTIGMQQVVQSGTGRRIKSQGLGWLNVAGKTGTTNESRDAWFAGFTGKHLAVVWVGNDQNEPTSLYGATGALPVWAELFKHLPTEPLSTPKDGIVWSTISPNELARARKDCPGAKRYAFVDGFVPQTFDNCYDEPERPKNNESQGWFGW